MSILKKLSVSMFISIILVLCTGYIDISEAEEQKCKDMGSFCVCSEPLNGPISSYVLTNTFAINPGDSLVKECTKASLQIPGSAIDDASGLRYVAETSGPMFTAMPNRTSAIQYLLRVKHGAEGYPGGGAQYMGHILKDSDPAQRVSLRVYRYWSNPYTWTDGSGLDPTKCGNSSKVLQFGNGTNAVNLIFDGPWFTQQVYAWQGWNLPAGFDCCWVGPGDPQYFGTYSPTNYAGKWYYLEMVITNRKRGMPPPTTFKLYRRNITDNGPLELIIDSTRPTFQPVGDQWDLNRATTLQPVADDIRELFLDSFRRDVCQGYQGFSHMMVAAWPTDEGQLIGPALEVEGGAANFTLTVTKSGTGGGTVTSSVPGINCGSTCVASYAGDTLVTLSASPISGSSFIGWTGNCTGTGVCIVTMNTARTVNAQFNTQTVSPPPGSIAAKYSKDSGIGNDPNVIFHETFESAPSVFINRFTGGSLSGVSSSTDVSSATGGIQSARLIPSSISGTLYKRLSTDYTELYMRYYIKYLGNISHHSGGYMGGYFPPTDFPQGDAGLKGIRPNGDRLFISAFEQAGASPGQPLTRLDTYNNWIDMQGIDFGGLYFGRSLLSVENHPINVGSWKCVEMRVKMNSTTVSRDGELQIWVDDNQVQNFIPNSPTGQYDTVGNWITGSGSGFPGLQWRDILSYGVNWIKLQNYSDVGTPFDVLYDDLVVGTSRIGCINQGSATDTTPPAKIRGLVVQ